MAKFLKVLAQNLRKGPSTDPFPLGETFTPANFRGKVTLNAERCMGCGICRHVCAAGAINISVRSDQSGYDFSVWHNSCCLCAQCRHFCPTKAITLSNDWHNAHPQEEKFTWIEQKFVPYVPCENCGASMRPLPRDMIPKLYAKTTDIDPEHIVRICPNCRKVEEAQRIEGKLQQTPPKNTEESAE